MMNNSVHPDANDHVLCSGITTDAVPFRHAIRSSNAQLLDFNQRRELTLFGLVGHLNFPGAVGIRFTKIADEILGGGGVAAINGGVIAAGFDAACVLAALMQFETKTVVTLTLQIHYLRLAKQSGSLEFQAWVTKSAHHICFVQAALVDPNVTPVRSFATATSTLAPIWTKARHSNVNTSSARKAEN